jgi:hypothetical protein
MSTSDLTTLAWDLASDGFTGRDADVRRVVSAARAAGVPAALVDTLADHRLPAPVRLRAFGRVAAALTAISDTPAPTSRAA